MSGAETQVDLQIESKLLSVSAGIVSARGGRAKKPMLGAFGKKFGSRSQACGSRLDLLWATHTHTHQGGSACVMGRKMDGDIWRLFPRQVWRHTSNAQNKTREISNKRMVQINT